MAEKELMSPKKPYLIRALNEWILDNQLTPHLLVDANIEGVEVPQQYVKDGRIILNVAPSAIDEIAFENEEIYFSARFSGKPFMVNVPIHAVLAIYARENGQGMIFSEDAPLAAENNESHPQTKEKNRNKKPTLTVVK